MSKKELKKILDWLSRDNLRYFRLTHEHKSIYNLSWGVEVDSVDVDVQEEKSNDVRITQHSFGGVQHYRARAYNIPDLLTRAISRENRVEYGGLSPEDFDIAKDGDEDGD